jgi:hypothetical protein
MNVLDQNRNEINQNPDDFEYTTSVESNIVIIREISKIRFRERLITLMPLIAQNLMDTGVDFSKVDFTKLGSVSDSDIDSIYEDLF